MCGILGYISNEKPDVARFKEALKLQSHRGPDHSDIKSIDKNINILLGHNRLAILDLSAQGNQPISSLCGRYTLIYNGEIYNYIELRNQHLNDKKLSSTGDAQVLVELIAKLGLNEALRQCNGMWALALYDHQENSISLSRDRFLF